MVKSASKAEVPLYSRPRSPRMQSYRSGEDFSTGGDDEEAELDRVPFEEEEEEDVKVDDEFEEREEEVDSEDE